MIRQTDIFSSCTAGKQKGENYIYILKYFKIRLEVTATFVNILISNFNLFKLVLIVNSLNISSQYAIITPIFPPKVFQFGIFMLNNEYMNIIYHPCERIRIMIFGIHLRALFVHCFYFFFTILGSITPFILCG